MYILRNGSADELARAGAGCYYKPNYYMYFVCHMSINIATTQYFVYCWENKLFLFIILHILHLYFHSHKYIKH